MRLPYGNKWMEKTPVNKEIWEAIGKKDIA
jgi:hypothetical protein